MLKNPEKVPIAHIQYKFFISSSSCSFTAPSPVHSSQTGLLTLLQTNHVYPILCFGYRLFIDWNASFPSPESSVPLPHFPYHLQIAGHQGLLILNTKYFPDLSLFSPHYLKLFCVSWRYYKAISLHTFMFFLLQRIAFFLSSTWQHSNLLITSTNVIPL